MAKKLTKYQVTKLLNDGIVLSGEYLDHLMNRPFYIGERDGNYKYYCQKGQAPKNLRSLEKIYLAEIL